MVVDGLHTAGRMPTEECEIKLKLKSSLEAVNVPCRGIMRYADMKTCTIGLLCVIFFLRSCHAQSVISPGTSNNVCEQRHCSHDDRVTIYESVDNVYVLVLAQVHQPGDNLFTCSDVIDTGVIQNIEAIFWVLDEMNKEKYLISGVELGALIIDTCGQNELVIRDVLNIFSGMSRFTLSRSNQSIALNNIVAVIELAAGSGDTMTDVVSSVGVTRISLNPWTQETDEKPPNAIHLATSIKQQAETFGALLKHLGYTFVSVVYAETDTGGAGLEAFKVEARKLGVCIALTIAVPRHTNLYTYMERALSFLKQRQNNGAHAVVLLLSSEQIQELVKALQRARISGAVQPGDFVLFFPTTWGNRELGNPTLNVDLRGSVSLSYPGENLDGFQRHFVWLEPGRNSRNLWFPAYWRNIFHCDPNSPECIRKQTFLHPAQFHSGKT